MAAVSQSLSEEQRKFLEECETQFKDRFTDNDEEFMSVHREELSRPPIVHPWWTPRYNRGGRNNGGWSDSKPNCDNSSADGRGTNERQYDQRQGYSGQQLGYNDNRRGYNDERRGYNDDRRGNNHDRQGYNNDRQGYSDNRKGYGDNRQGYDNKRRRY